MSYPTDKFQNLLTLPVTRININSRKVNEFYSQTCDYEVVYSIDVNGKTHSLVTKNIFAIPNYAECQCNGSGCRLSINDPRPEFVHCISCFDNDDLMYYDESDYITIECNGLKCRRNIQDFDNGLTHCISCYGRLTDEDKFRYIEEHFLGENKTFEDILYDVIEYDDIFDDDIERILNHING